MPLFSAQKASFLLVLTASFHAAGLQGQAPRPEIISPQVKSAVDKGLTWLLKQQQPSGYFSEQKTDKKPQRGDMPSHSGAMTALAIMGLASVGHLPGDPTPEGQAAQKALRYIVDNVQPDENGYLGRSDRSRMYGHGIMTLMLTEMLGMSPDEETDKKVRSMTEKAIKLIIRAQQVPKSEANRGGWRYEPASSDSDISVSVWQLMSLRAAKNSGIEVPKEAIDNGIAYIKRSYRGERDSNGNLKQLEAAFSYEPYGGRQTFSTTSAGLLSLQVAGQYDAPEVLGSSNWLLKFPPEVNEPWFYYGCYYYAQGMYQRGGDHAATARQKTEQMLVGAQSAEGSWHPKNGNEKSAGPVYATSLALLSLSVYHHFLPIYQK
ncbi:A-macroglobulin complement component [Prosthecobacter fusiformis]|uniref:A-macroglobulin complement component n=1 Tax=Prosthecobacter fusiformis TaxID=48464 RepID=A0A4R7SPI8_9BACT|nr:prenyltransferase/squalene oxidase repeat-containing protein [Prosthecobacter fusiformis]TDU80911.1 A-macroglobulin complement component [Prosthecobacter fusiformis]